MNGDLEVVMGNGRLLLRFADFVELADLVDRLSAKSVMRPLDNL